MRVREIRRRVPFGASAPIYEARVIEVTAPPHADCEPTDAPISDWAACDSPIHTANGLRLPASSAPAPASVPEEVPPVHMVSADDGVAGSEK